MRSFDKKNNIKKANLLAEERYLQTKGLIKEGMYDSKGNFKGGPDPDKENFEPDERDYDVTFKCPDGTTYTAFFNQTHDKDIVEISKLIITATKQPVTPQDFSHNDEFLDVMYDAKKAAIKYLDLDESTVNVPNQPIDELSTGLAHKASDMRAQQFTDASNGGDDVNPLQQRKNFQQHRTFDKYVNPEMLKQLYALNAKVFEASSGQIVLGISEDMLPSYPANADVVLVVYPDTYKVTGGSLNKLTDESQIRKLQRIIQKLQMDMKRPANNEL